MLNQSFVEEMKNSLLAAKGRLQQELQGLSAHTELGDDADENADEVGMDEMNKNMIARIQADLEKIDTALAKIAAGTYGTDDEGKEIGEDRLRAIPWADKAI